MSSLSVTYKHLAVAAVAALFFIPVVTHVGGGISAAVGGSSASDVHVEGAKPATHVSISEQSLGD
ncbi:hypothetical protein OG462_43340 [Streptomyces sp. NBC_01077]|uniref:hypothetical protein n=1 Tax=Streptomyces sp. NBC_01077 TaxID=2903746 RepID=UPI00386793A2|nr:hypothetical protein OG462_01665 [Streptomyces sp. NBC_01077]WSV43610.1 hypothetical protein OG462_43340 [Streptomyces sp. NBC_01077]